jgi:hypothetical protein
LVFVVTPVVTAGFAGVANVVATGLAGTAPATGDAVAATAGAITAGLGAVADTSVLVVVVVVTGFVAVAEIEVSVEVAATVRIALCGFTTWLFTMGATGLADSSLVAEPWAIAGTATAVSSSAENVRREKLVIWGVP